MSRVVQSWPGHARKVGGSPVLYRRMYLGTLLQTWGAALGFNASAWRYLYSTSVRRTVDGKKKCGVDFSGEGLCGGKPGVGLGKWLERCDFGGTWIFGGKFVRVGTARTEVF